MIHKALKAVHEMSPAYLHELCKLHRPGRSLRSIEDHLRLEIAPPVAFADRAFNWLGFKKWNELSSNLRELENFEDLKRRLKTFYFAKAYANL